MREHRVSLASLRDERLRPIFAQTLKYGAASKLPELLYYADPVVRLQT